MSDFWQGFQKTADSMRPRVVIFHADWSAPSRDYLRVLERVKKQFDKVPIQLIDMDKNRDLVSKLEIKSAPMTLIVRGERLDRNTIIEKRPGVLEEKAIRDMLQMVRSGMVKKASMITHALKKGLRKGHNSASGKLGAGGYRMGGKTIRTPKS